MAELVDELTGIPNDIAQIAQAIADGLPEDEAQQWQRQIHNAINPGANLSKTWNTFALWMFTDPAFGIIRFVDEAGREGIQAVCTLHRRVIGGEIPDEGEWEATRSFFKIGGTGPSGAARQAARAATHRIGIWASVTEAAEAVWEDSGDATRQDASRRMFYRLIEIVHRSGR